MAAQVEADADLAPDRLLPAEESNEGVTGRKEEQKKSNETAGSDPPQSQTETKLLEKNTSTADHTSRQSDEHRSQAGSRVQGQGRGKQGQADHGGRKVRKDVEHNEPRVRVVSRTRGGGGGGGRSKAGGPPETAEDDPSLATADVDKVSRGRGGKRAIAGVRGSRGGRSGTSGGARAKGKIPGEASSVLDSGTGRGSLVAEEGRGKDPSSTVRVKPGKSQGPEAAAVTGKQQDSSEKVPQSAQIASDDSQKYTKPKKPAAKPPRAAQSAPTPSVQSDVLSQQLLSATYECVVCCGRVKLDHAVWSCSNCYHIFHMHCIKKWAKRPPDLEAGGRRLEVTGEA